MSFLRWRKRKKGSRFSCVSAIVATRDDATDAILRFDVIEQRRVDLKMSKGRLADLVGVDQSTIWRWRRRGMKPAHQLVQRLAEALELPINEISGGADDHR